jgi:hypothetical protein
VLKPLVSVFKLLWDEDYLNHLLSLCVVVVDVVVGLLKLDVWSLKLD